MDVTVGRMADLLLAPRKPGAVGRERQAGDRPRIAIADGHRNLPRAARLHEAVDRDLEPGGLAQVIGGLPGHVPRRAVRERRGDDELLGLLSRCEDPGRRYDSDRTDRGHLLGVIDGTRRDPSR